ncbi:MAG: SurA N-terminal domain-containing protein, partial [Acidobacteria bacterium]|nr:SurA N-terminal domain-containing protein [Acidobacteriota bacterium]
MRGCRKAFRVLAAATVALLGVSLAGSLVRAEILEEIVAKVNNSMITRTQLQERLAVYEQQLKSKYSGDELEAKTEAAADGLLRNMITETLL